RTAFGAALVVGALAFGASALPGQSSTYLHGIDVSHYQGTINWTNVANSGVSFVFCKATEGTTYTDPMFASYWPAIKSHGMVRGAYHCGHPGSDANAQAIFFVNTVQPEKGDLQMALDLEVTDGLTHSQVWTWTQTFCAKIEALTHRPAIIYCSPSFWQTS